MTSPSEQITLKCARCGERYTDWMRASVNFEIESFSEECVREATSATCPCCRLVVELGSLVVPDGVWEFGGEAGA